MMIKLDDRSIFTWSTLPLTASKPGHFFLRGMLGMLMCDLFAVANLVLSVSVRIQPDIAMQTHVACVLLFAVMLMVRLSSLRFNSGKTASTGYQNNIG